MTSLSHPVSSLSRRSATSPLAVVLGAVARWRDDRRARLALARLDDHLLRDIGLAPSGAVQPLPSRYSAF
ncbi:DUF1127 domain-containing protein [Rhodobacter capsulatus]|jgi:uncharacterized protein YjiS (DUF1127 family)|uniref:YjiS-like domain-containing protein n=1 Tax=Rhodobacter capsulatus (strain ATCC BAA-309 / NBRC 16581 / SB1003) TaxID=272942 RepID=D5AUK3_RHOCB|nr:DUF1127 domain-containing protein [Rhodobacter capsulatus]ADE85642.1 protein of unknown function DUF1127 [Rhodobacter capsulatus SB 1003]ETD01670.1 hypothetical protein U714_10795 [Rhodobacter capsulatus DE442]ETD76737.1 hypothetical protein U717_10950 [Rhodobacter capsulatus R121]ETD84407.1 hypothetical protein U703_04580 [Rhodobacter capsulatus YW1]ETD85927.1 hypothetical protein U716_03610 [Rhodobacter capsulatus B6]